ncbi:MAG: hypothetical protein CMN17_11855 [Roseovarius sp.]|nr:hypothetical protein [Roseovarius sp.]MBK44180.1 hypothetical protein [Roseovarius sp.]
MHIAELIDDNKCAANTFGEHIALLIERVHEGRSTIGLHISSRDVFTPLLGTDARLLCIGGFRKARLKLVTKLAVFVPPLLEPFRQFVPEFFGKNYRHVAETCLVERVRDRLHLCCIDARPDDMAMLAAFLLVEDNGTRLSCKAQLVFDGVYRLEILLARERLMGIYGQRKERLLRARPGCDQLDLGKGAMQIIGDGAAHFG